MTGNESRVPEVPAEERDHHCLEVIQMCCSPTNEGTAITLLGAAGLNSHAGAPGINKPRKRR